MSQPDVVIVGAGLAAAKAATALRDGGYDGAVTIVGEEPHPPYERPPLSKDILLGKGSRDDALVHPREWYDEHDVTLLTGRRAEKLDPAAHQVVLDDGTVLDYGKLVLATGARPRVLDVPGAARALTLRRVEDSEALLGAFASASSLVVIGAGWIGLEVAAAAREAALDVTVLEVAPVPLATVLGEKLGSYFADLHRKHGVDLRTSTGVESISETGVTAGGEEIRADLVVMGVGAVPNTELAEAAGLEVDGGVVVDQHFTASLPDILAIGDVAAARHTDLGPLRVEHWDNAIRQGKAVAAVLLGQDVAYDWQPYFFTDQYDLGMEYVGRGKASDDVVIRGDLDSGEFIAFWLDGIRVTAGMNVNVWDVNDDLRALVGRTVDATRLADPSVALTEVADG
ncbi:NAD(P)/FAD-dependent oxidoreductase [Aeromicrobium terrae]|uniref:Ferredoxin reductase n=1 Tax=Aeromicrobium terrae TaxID=2498846 RepID=A0A5C8NFQ0_9ACTN|nr:FAD-dependent oxidoreductase [Aeromicrobium terrae]TXL56596.1 ferredoxin reductase [Aeromicrobium terrae]